MEDLIRKNNALRTAPLYYSSGRLARRTRLFWRGTLSGAKLLSALFAMLLSTAVHAQLQRPTIQVSLVRNNSAADPTFIYFQAGATIGFDGAFDATKLPNSTGLNLSSFAEPTAPTGREQLSINGLPTSLLAAPSTVKLFVGVPAYTTADPSDPSAYTLIITQFDFFTSTRVFLVDSLLNTSVPLSLGTIYPFDITAANRNSPFRTTRFSLFFEPTTLPVTLTSFTAQAQPPGVALAWHTATERNSAYFAVERSVTGQAYTEIGRVTAAGTSAQARSYTFYDPQPLGGTSYYRLRQVDTDNTFQYSPVRAVGSPSASAELVLFPNPARAGTALRGVAPGTLLQLLNTLGQVVATALADASGTVALPSNLPSGVYVVRSNQQATRLVIN